MGDILVPRYSRVAIHPGFPGHYRFLTKYPGIPRKCLETMVCPGFKILLDKIRIFN